MESWWEKVEKKLWKVICLSLVAGMLFGDFISGVVSCYLVDG